MAFALVACIAAKPVNAQAVDAEEADTENFDVALDEISIDVANSIGNALETRGLTFDGDLRVGQVFTGDDFDDVRLGEADALRARWRLRTTWGITEQLRGVFRVAGLCSTGECDPDFILQPDLPGNTSVRDGQITIDEFFLQRFRSERFNVALGRMQVKSVARGGVFSKSLDQNNSNNLRINWTDGLHTTYKANNGWETHMVLQYNSKDGAGNVRRNPLDFTDSGSRVAYSFGFENLEEKRRLIQRALNINYYPSALLIDGQIGGAVEDYLAIVGRWAGRWPVRSEGWSFRVSGEVGYAPTTASKAATGIVGAGDTDGLAWNVTASVMDFFPKHSIGINYAQTGAGWLLSPQYSNNERLAEIRYMWRPTNRLTLDIRGRWRDELQQRIIDDPNQGRFDAYIRFTWGFDILQSET
jgi:hypothetical protein